MIHLDLDTRLGALEDDRVPLLAAPGWLLYYALRVASSSRVIEGVVRFERDDTTRQHESASCDVVIGD